MSMVYLFLLFVLHYLRSSETKCFRNKVFVHYIIIHKCHLFQELYARALVS